MKEQIVERMKASEQEKESEHERMGGSEEKK